MNVNKFLSLQTGEENKNKVREDVIKNISFRGANLWILSCAIFIACIGLNVNSTAVIIGAMLISPLMGPIVGSGFALATYDFELLKRAGKNLLIATLAGLAVSSAYFFLSPFKEVQSELLARTSPNIYDVMIAFFGGIVGAVSITRIEKGNPIPGVAIATALMPPLCTAGFGLATFNFKFMVGALYLYCINCFFIGIATFLILKYLNYRAISTASQTHDKKVRMVISFIMLLLIVPSCYLAYTLLQEKKFSQKAERFISQEFTSKGDIIIYKNINYNKIPKNIELGFLNKKFDTLEINAINRKLIYYGITNTTVQIKQNTADFKKEILSEINKQNSVLNQKDLQLTSIHQELSQYKIGSFGISKEVKILFPDITKIAFGTVSNYESHDSLSTDVMVVYEADKLIDQVKLKSWMESRLGKRNIVLIQETQPESNLTVSKK